LMAKCPMATPSPAGSVGPLTLGAIIPGSAIELPQKLCHN
jgi:hypothetical protein